MLKALTVYINSSLATYYLLVTSSTWGIDRRKLNKNEVLGLPSQVLHDEATVVRLAELYDEHRKGRTLKEQTSVVERMDLAVFDALDIAPNERIIVRDTLRVGALYIDSGKRASVLGRPSIDALKEYAAAFKDTLDSVLGSGAQHVVPIIRHGEASLCVVSFRVASSAAPGTPVVIEQRDDLRKALDELDAILWSREGINVYRRRHVRVFEDGVVSIVKPAEARFWTAAAAFHDADETIGQVLGGTRGSR